MSTGEVTERPAAGADTVSAPGFRSLMSEFPSGVAVVTATGDDGAPWGMTCSSLCSVSASPPTLLACLRTESPTLAAILAGSAFAVNLLHADGQPVAELFSSGTPDRFDLVPWVQGPAGPHLSRHSHATADCRVSGSTRVGSHLVVLGEVYDVTHRHGHAPLLYGRRRYRHWPGQA